MNERGTVGGGMEPKITDFRKGSLEEQNKRRKKSIHEFTVKYLSQKGLVI